MRSALLRVLTDLYVQKLTHTPDEERHYTELALRLIETVDATTRAAVAAQLGKHLSPPRQVIERLAEDLLEVTDALRSWARHPEAREARPLLLTELDRKRYRPSERIESDRLPGRAVATRWAMAA